MKPPCRVIGRAVRYIKRCEVRNDFFILHQGRLEVQVGNLKSATRKRDIPLNDNAVEMIHLLQDEVYLGEDAPLNPTKSVTSPTLVVVQRKGVLR